MALSVLPLMAFTATLLADLQVTRPQSMLDSNQKSQKSARMELLRSERARLKTVDVYHQTVVSNTKSNKAMESYSNKTTKLPFQIVSSQVYRNEKTNVTNKNLSHDISLFTESNVTDNNLLHNISMLQQIDMTSQNPLHRSLLWKQTKSKQKQFTNSDTSTARIMGYRTSSKLHSAVSQENGRNAERNFGLGSFGHRQKRVRSTRQVRSEAEIDRLRYPEKHALYTPLSTSFSNTYGLNKVTFRAQAFSYQRECTYQGTTCDCSSRGLTAVPQDLPTSITELLLKENDIKMLPKDVFSRYPLLEYLDLYHNSVSALEEGSFNGLSRLTSLDLHANNITTYESIHELTFKPLHSLKVLRLYLNIFSCQLQAPFPDAALSYLHNLEELYIDNYIDPDSEDIFGPGFSNMTYLRKLSFSCYACTMESLWNTTFINFGQITSLYISNCDINGRYIETETFAHLKNLLTLDISRNPNIGVEYLPVILWGLRNSGLQTLIMNYIVSQYSMTFINSSVIQYLPQRLTLLVARGNNMLSIDPEAVRKLPKSLKTIDISENYLIMNPEDIPLDQMVGLEELFIHSKSDECLGSHGNNFIQPPRLVSDFQEHHFHVDGKENQTRTFGKESKMGVVIPRKLKRVQVNVEGMHDDFLLDIDELNSLEELDVSCSYIPVFEFDSLVHLQNLRYINVRKSSVRWIYLPQSRMRTLNSLVLGSNDLGDFMKSKRGLFVHFNNLSYLDLSQNQINYIEKDFFDGLDQLEYLRLEGNPISYFDAAISNMPHLKIFNLSNTGLSHLPNDVRSHIDQLCKDRPGQIRVNMADCPIQCDCFNLDFLKWMVNSPAFDKNFTGYRCKYPDSSFKHILDGYQETIRVLDRECAKNYPMFLIVLAATSVLLCAVMGAIFYRLRWKIRYLYYAAYLKFTDKHKNDNNQEFAYDVFISYDSEDQAFVTRCLSPELENRGLRLLIHTRDFVAGTYITSNIVMAVTESRKTLVVLTRNLVESTWCNYELQMATMEAVHTGRQVLVFLLKENIPSRELDVELLGHIRSNTYLPYPTPEEEGDEDMMKRFYDKLAHDLRC